MDSVRFARVVALVIALAPAVACRSSEPAIVVEDPGPPPLPPTSGTPIGLMVDEAARLKLRDEQISKLREIDEALVSHNESVEAQLRALDRPPAGGGGEGGPPQGGGRRGGGGGRGGGGMSSGMGGGGMGGGMGGGGPGGGGRGQGGHHRGGPGGGSGAPRPDDPQAAATRKRLDDERTGNFRAAMQQAFAVLDPDQRTAAQALLDERGATGERKPGPGAANGAETGAENERQLREAPDTEERRR